MLLCFDGGGTSARMILVDGNYNLIGSGHANGVNTNHTPLEEVRANLQNCLTQALSGRTLNENDEAVITIVGPFAELEALLAPYNCRIRCLTETQAALLAGAMRTSGFVALSGTGSFVAYSNNPAEPDARHVLGGVGLLMGDEGSGAWLGQQALRAVVRHLQGNGPPTALTARAKQFLGIGDHRQIIRQLYTAPSYIRYMAAFVPQIAAAATEGDETALSLFTQAGEHLAQELLTLPEKINPPDEDNLCTLAGGVWKAHPAMHETFRTTIQKTAPKMQIRRPFFEAVMAGVVEKLAAEQPAWSVQERFTFLAERFPEYVYKINA